MDYRVNKAYRYLFLFQHIGLIPFCMLQEFSILVGKVMPKGLLVIFCAPFVISTAYLWLTEYNVHIMGQEN